MGKIQKGITEMRTSAASEVHRLCLKIRDQVDKDQWWSAMANANDLVAACQQGCREEIARVAEKRASRDFDSDRTPKTKPKTKSKKKKRKKKAKP
jgi:hypothetical protein